MRVKYSLVRDTHIYAGTRPRDFFQLTCLRGKPRTSKTQLEIQGRSISTIRSISLIQSTWLKNKKESQNLKYLRHYLKLKTKKRWKTKLSKLLRHFSNSKMHGNKNTQTVVNTMNRNIIVRLASKIAM